MIVAAALHGIPVIVAGAFPVVMLDLLSTTVCFIVTVLLGMVKSFVQ